MEWSLIAVAVVLAALFYTQESAAVQYSTPPPRRSVYSDMHAHQNVIPLKHA